jgi:hypothetical protein
VIGGFFFYEALDGYLSVSQVKLGSGISLFLCFYVFKECMDVLDGLKERLYCSQVHFLTSLMNDALRRRRHKIIVSFFHSCTGTYNSKESHVEILTLVTSVLSKYINI